jgi:hypothetical protein
VHFPAALIMNTTALFRFTTLVRRAARPRRFTAKSMIPSAFRELDDFFKPLHFPTASFLLPKGLEFSKGFQFGNADVMESKASACKSVL